MIRSTNQDDASPGPLTCFFILLCTAALLLATGCDRGPAAMMRGDYVNANGDGHLTVTGSTMKASYGPMTINADYTVQKTQDKTVTVALTGQGVDKGLTLGIQVDADTLLISGNGPMGGTWKRK